MDNGPTINAGLAPGSVDKPVAKEAQVSDSQRITNLEKKLDNLVARLNKRIAYL